MSTAVTKETLNIFIELNKDRSRSHVLTLNNLLSWILLLLKDYFGKSYYYP